MPHIKPQSDDLRQQIAASQDTHYLAQEVEFRIASALLANGSFDEAISGSELAIILRHAVYAVFAKQKIAGLETGLVHNVPFLTAAIENSRADVRFTVHIHRPIIAFLEFPYTLVNDPDPIADSLRLRERSFRIEKRVRRFDLKAKAALAGVNIEKISHRELADIGAIVATTLPTRLERHAITGQLEAVALRLTGDLLHVRLDGSFGPTES